MYSEKRQYIYRYPFVLQKTKFYSPSLLHCTLLFYSKTEIELSRKANVHLFIFSFS